MSYDIRFGVQTAMPNIEGERFVIVGRPDYDSPTYNLRDMFVACMDWNYEQSHVDDDGIRRTTWYPMTEVLPRIERGIRELTENREEYEKYNPPNGWGDLDGALRCLRNWKAELGPRGESMPFERVGDNELTEKFDFERVTYTWPVEALWWSW